jgi:multicomponent Na+:H+ antiporter subunit F
VNNLLISACIILAITISLCLYKGAVGPTIADRLVAVNVIGTKTVVLISLVSFIFEKTFFLDVALVYALISFLTTIMVADYMVGENKKEEEGAK